LRKNTIKTTAVDDAVLTRLKGKARKYLKYYSKITEKYEGCKVQRTTDE
jgi:hypothetical protein